MRPDTGTALADLVQACTLKLAGEYTGDIHTTGWDSPFSTITVPSSSISFCWKSTSQGIDNQGIRKQSINPGETHPRKIISSNIWATIHITIHWHLN